ncbi:unnamed protein product [Cuscuta epithymum]|uniref:Endoglucanase n=1 Tax=Cuscuta epithymum TaxID=186058 RepID=A0AAV0GHQ5_9ASTE|nr:unnamed protein product [Cuscuta epithymum]CAH9147485.1 unnamed protein product [Cuscuta epithymum]
MMTMGRGEIRISLLVLLAAAAEGYDYGDALSKTLLFFKAQRSGRLGSDNSINWRWDSALSDGKAEGAELVGGYYDAGDNVKFGLPMAFAMTMLSWAAADHFSTHSDLFDAIKWGTDYLINAHTQPNTLFVQVGDGDSDHLCWMRPEDMTTSRTAYKIDEAHPGSDVAGETSAALAAASIAFKQRDSSYSHTLLQHAQQLFTFATAHKGSYQDSIPGASKYYKSYQNEDEVVWAAAWLYKATNERQYLDYVVQNAASVTDDCQMKEVSWETKCGAVQVLVSKIYMEEKQELQGLQKYKERADFFTCACMQKNQNAADNVELTPGGLIYVRPWNNLEYASANAAVMAIYSKYLDGRGVRCSNGESLTDDQILEAARSQADYILGKNRMGMSYVVGVGPKFPQRVHHRAASIDVNSEAYRQLSMDGPERLCAGGYAKFYPTSDPNPYVITGALVGGPAKDDTYLDARDSYEQSEPTLSGTSTASLLFAVLSSSHNHGAAAAVQLMHSIVSKWSVGNTQYCHHKVVITAANSNTTITDLKFRIDHLSPGTTLWGLSKLPPQDNEAGIFYALPPWANSIHSTSTHTVLYVQRCQQAKISLLSYRQL